MPLSTIFQDSDVEYVREICRIPNTADRISILVGRMDALNPAQVIATQRDITKWQAIEYGTERSKGGIKGTDYSTDRNRDYITNKMRERLAYPALPTTSDPDAMSYLALGFPTGMGSLGTDEFSR